MNINYSLFNFNIKKNRWEELIMAEINMDKVIGETFEDMSISEMTRVQGSGDVEGRSLLTVSAALTGAAATWSLSVGVVQTIKGKC